MSASCDCGHSSWPGRLSTTIWVDAVGAVSAASLEEVA